MPSFEIASPFPVDAYCSTGSSPGRPPVPADPARRGTVTTTLPLADVSVEPVVVRLRYELQGPPTAPVHVILGGISAHAHVCSHPTDPTPGWWEGVVGRGAAVDTERVRVLGLDHLGADGTMPTRPEGAVWPLDARDHAAALERVLDALQIDTVETVIGASFGGSVALAFALRAGARVRRLVLLGAAHRPHALASAVRTVQREIVLDGIAAGRARAAVARARRLALTTYRAAREVDARFPCRDAPFPPAALEAWLHARGERYSETVSAAAFLMLSGAIDRTRLRPEDLRVPATFVSFRDDAVVPGWLVQELTDRSGAPSEHLRIDTDFGHDGFLKEPMAVGRVLAAAVGGRS